jgi:membrane protease subunit HflC
MRRLFPVLVLAAVAVALLWAGNYGLGPVVIVREGEAKIVLRFGEAIKILDEPGLNFRIPLIDRVIVYDARLQYASASPAEMLAKGGESLIIDFYAVWRLSDAHAFRRSYPRGFVEAEKRILETIVSRVREMIGRSTRAELLARSAVLASLDDLSELALSSTGIDIVDVRLNRIDLPRAAEPAAYDQMREQRRAISRELRAVGERRAREIRANADREAELTLAAARSEAEVKRGEGDAQSAGIYAEAYGRDPEFYAFVRSLEAYRAALKGRTTMVLAPDHPFFRFLDPAGATPPVPPPVSAP